MGGESNEAYACPRSHGKTPCVCLLYFIATRGSFKRGCIYCPSGAWLACLFGLSINQHSHSHTLRDTYTPTSAQPMLSSHAANVLEASMPFDSQQRSAGSTHAACCRRCRLTIARDQCARVAVAVARGAAICMRTAARTVIDNRWSLAYG